jgi:hypothetical protein
MACPVTPLTSLNTLANWIFICVSNLLYPLDV